MFKQTFGHRSTQPLNDIIVQFKSFKFQVQCDGRFYKFFIEENTLLAY